MRKPTVIFSTLGIIVLGFFAISIKAAQADFAATWVVDKEKTRGLPHELKNYTMVVSRNENQLVVETKVESTLQAPGTAVNVPEGGWAVPGHKTGGSMVSANGTGGTFGGLAAGGIPTGGSATGGMALWLVNPKVAYPLDGGEISEPLVGLANATVKVKSKWGKDGKALDLSYVQVAQGGHSAMLTIKERWTLSAEGDELKVQRSVVTQQGADTVVLILKKGPGAPKPPQP
jgi:hypothetical protein